MSDENEDKIEQTFIDQLGAKYPMAKIDKGDTQKYGIRYYPSIYCIAPDGTVHSVPDDKMPSPATIERLLEDVSLVPGLPDDSRYAPVRKMWEKRQHEQLNGYLEKMLQADKLDAEMREVFQQQLDTLKAKAEKQSARVQSLAKGPDYYAARASLERIEKEWRGFPAAEQAEQELKRFSKDKEIKKEIAASKALVKLLAKNQPTSIVKARKLQEALRKFADKYEGTYAGAQALKKLSR